MLTFLVAALFIICMALASGSILLTNQLRMRRTHKSFSTLLYLQVFLLMFGFYAIWGQVIISYFISPVVEPKILDRINNLVILLASPFIIFAWYMLVRLAHEICNKRMKVWITPVFIGFNTILLLLIGITPNSYPKAEVFLLVKIFYLVFNLLYSTWASFILYGGKSDLLTLKSLRLVSLGILISMILQGVCLLFYSAELWQSMTFTFVFFTGSAFVPVYLYYILPGNDPAIHSDFPSFEAFCRKFEISPREKDIIREICNGHSNQQIADNLFISLQTVKDHTHRIYSKVDVKNRVQLIKMVEPLNR